MLKLRLAERWARLGPSGAGMLVLLMLSALSLTGFWLAFEPARDPGGCVTLAARGVRAVRSCEPDDIALQILFGLAIGSLFGFLVLRLLWRVGREFLRPLPDEPLHGVLQLLLNLAHVSIQARSEHADGLQLDLLRLGQDGSASAAFRLQLDGLQQHTFYPEHGRPRDLLPLLKPGTRLRFAPATQLAHPQHAQIDASIVGQSFASGQLSLKARDYRLQPLPLPPADAPSAT
jgi:hypothetical protein